MAKMSGKKVLITGAAGGIGLCTAREFAKAGSELVMTDINGAALKEAATSIRELGAVVHTYSYDVSDNTAVLEAAGRIMREVGDVDILINNAGVGHNGELAGTGLDTWKKLVNINLFGVLHHVYAFLPRMKARRSGQIVNVSSGQAFFRLPTWGAYAAVKAALGAFSEILHFELRKFDIGVTTVYPFMVDTGFYKGVEGDTRMARLSMKLIPFYSMTPEKVGKIIFKAAKKQVKVEKVSIFNDFAFYAQIVPYANDLIARVSNAALTQRVR